MSTELQTVCSLMGANTVELQDALLEVVLPPREEPKRQPRPLHAVVRARGPVCIRRRQRARALNVSLWVR